MAIAVVVSNWEDENTEREEQWRCSKAKLKVTGGLDMGNGEGKQPVTKLEKMKNFQPVDTHSDETS
jgi:hypothetical protein